MENSKQTEEIKTEEKDNKPGIFTLIIGILLLVRGGMRIANDEIEIFGIIMIAVGIGSIVYYFMKK
jgi:uncharacterized membrane protein HdeD (DUF308 family)